MVGPPVGLCFPLFHTQEAPDVTLLQPPLVIFSTAVDVCPHGLPAHTGGGSQDALAVLLVVKVGGSSHFSSFWLGKGHWKKQPSPPPSNMCSQLVRPGRLQSLLGRSGGTWGSGPRPGCGTCPVHPFSLQTPCTAGCRGPGGLRLGKHRAPGIGNESYTQWGADKCCWKYGTAGSGLCK